MSSEMALNSFPLSRVHFSYIVNILNRREPSLKNAAVRWNSAIGTICLPCGALAGRGEINAKKKARVGEAPTRALLMAVMVHAHKNRQLRFSNNRVFYKIAYNWPWSGFAYRQPLTSRRPVRSRGLRPALHKADLPENYCGNGCAGPWHRLRKPLRYRLGSALSGGSAHHFHL